MDDIVWVGKDDGEPDWTVGGTYMVVRPIRMFVERWDRTALSEQEGIIGRTKRTGAPLGRRARARRPGLWLRPGGRPDPGGRPHPAGQPADRRDAAQPDPAPRLLVQPRLRRGRAPGRGAAVRLLPARPRAGFVTVQNRLSGEPLEEYIQTVGGGYFFAPPGVTTSDGILGGSLLQLIRAAGAAARRSTDG